MSFVNSRKEKEIVVASPNGEQKFVLTQYDAFRGIAYQRKLIKIIQPSFSAIVHTMAENKEVSMEMLALEKFMENIDQVEPAFLKELVLQGAYKEGRVTINFENDFAGNYGVLFKLVWEIIMFNFSDLFTLLGSNPQA